MVATFLAAPAYRQAGLGNRKKQVVQTSYSFTQTLRMYAKLAQL